MPQDNSAVSVFLLWIGDCGYSDCKALCMQVVDRLVPVFRDLMLDAVREINVGSSAVNYQFLMPGNSDTKDYCSDNTSYGESDWCKGGNLRVSNISLFNPFVDKMCENDLCDKLNKKMGCFNQIQSDKAYELGGIALLWVVALVYICRILSQSYSIFPDEESEKKYSAPECKEASICY